MFSYNIISLFGNILSILCLVHSLQDIPFWLLAESTLKIFIPETCAVDLKKHRIYFKKTSNSEFGVFFSELFFMFRDKYFASANSRSGLYFFQGAHKEDFCLKPLLAVKYALEKHRKSRWAWSLSDNFQHCSNDSSLKNANFIDFFFTQPTYYASHKSEWDLVYARLESSIDRILIWFG